jgi:Sugar (and other) transporter
MVRFSLLSSPKMKKCDQTDKLQLHLLGMAQRLLPGLELPSSTLADRCVCLVLQHIFILLLTPQEAGWRVPLAIQTIFPLTLIVLVWFLPESPRWCKPSSTFSFLVYCQYGD